MRELIRRISAANPGWGARRIHGELGKLGINVSETTVAKHMVRFRFPPSQTWRAFLRNHVKELVSADFFVVPTATFRLLFVFVVLSLTVAAPFTSQSLDVRPRNGQPSSCCRLSPGTLLRVISISCAIATAYTARHSVKRLLGLGSRKCFVRRGHHGRMPMRSG